MNDTPGGTPGSHPTDDELTARPVNLFSPRSNADDFPDLDLDRLPHEITRALEKDAGIIPEQMTPGLRIRPEENDLVVISGEGDDVCRIPRYRLERADYERLPRFVTASLAQLPADIVAEATAAMQAGEQATVYDPPNKDEVGVMIAGHKIALIHRSHLVDGWPPA